MKQIFQNKASDDSVIFFCLIINDYKKTRVRPLKSSNNQEYLDGVGRGCGGGGVCGGWGKVVTK